MEMWSSSDVGHDTEVHPLNIFQQLHEELRKEKQAS